MRTPLIALILAAPSLALAGASPITIAVCGDSKLAVVAGDKPTTGELHATVVSAGSRWTFTARLGQVRIGGKTRTISIEDLATQERLPPRGNDATPSGMSIDVLRDDKKVVLRHASEGGADREYAVDLAKCSFPREGDVALATFVPPPVEPVGCAAAVVAGTYRKQIAQVAQLGDAEADRAAQALCEDHQKTLAARARLEQAITDRAARARVAARGAALFHVEDAREKAWAKIDGCLGADPGTAHGVAALHDGEARQRACYNQVAARP
ncbi:MAG TPA: hypothetical protein VFP84_22810 [Kofleriaceae bacterium]|nr:hypothetical protein [Kofleriaceae bacterium]